MVLENTPFPQAGARPNHTLTSERIAAFAAAFFYSNLIKPEFANFAIQFCLRFASAILDRSMRKMTGAAFGE